MDTKCSCSVLVFYLTLIPYLPKLKMLFMLPRHVDNLSRKHENLDGYSKLPCTYFASTLSWKTTAGPALHGVREVVFSEPVSYPQLSKRNSPGRPLFRRGHGQSLGVLHVVVVGWKTARHGDSIARCLLSLAKETALHYSTWHALFRQGHCSILESCGTSWNNSGIKPRSLYANQWHSGNPCKCIDLPSPSSLLK